jgi:uncharacterized protein involved in outer membrane biogenesis
MRKTTLVLGIVAGLLVLALAGLWIFANPNSYRDVIQAQLEKQLGRKVTLGEMSLGLLPFRFQVENPVIAEDASVGQQAFVRAEKLDIRVGLFSLLQGKVDVDSLELRRPSVELVRTKQGTWNFATLGPKSSTSTAGVNPASGPSGSSTSFTLGKLTILDGQLGITDLQKGAARTGYDHIDLTLLDYTPGKPFSFDLAAHIQGKGAQEIRLKGEGGPVSDSNPAETPFSGDLILKEVEVGSLMKFLDSKVITSANGVLSGESKIANQKGNITTSGTLNLDKAQVNGLDIGYPIKVDYKLMAAIAESLMTIEDAKLQLGQTPISVAGTLNAAGRVPVMDLKLKSGDVSIAEIARLASAFGVAFAPGTTVTGRVSADVRAKGPTTKPELAGTIAGRDLKISGQSVPQPVQVKAVDLALSPTMIKSNEFTATSGKTNVMGQFSLSQYASDSPSVDVGLKAPEATLPEIQSIAKAYGLTGLDQLNGQGSLNFDFRAKGPLQSLNATSATRALNGTLNLDFSPLSIAGFDTAHELGKLGGFLSSLSAEQNATEIVKIIGKVLVKDGIAQTDDLRAQLAIGNLSTSGTADLAAETLNMKTAAVFTKEFSDKIRSSRAGGIMDIALSNNAGEIVLPAIISGSFKKPSFTPDLKALAQLQKQKLLPSLDNPGAVGNILGLLSGKKDSNTEKTSADKTQDQPTDGKRDAIKGILDLFGRKKNPDQK